MKQEPNRLRLLRAERRLTQMLLWRKCGIAASRISLIENGVVEATHEERTAIAKALKVSVNDIFPPSEEAVAS